MLHSFWYITQMKTFTAVKINEAVAKKNLKGLKDKEYGS